MLFLKTTITLVGSRIVLCIPRILKDIHSRVKLNKIIIFQCFIKHILDFFFLLNWECSYPPVQFVPGLDLCWGRALYPPLFVLHQRQCQHSKQDKYILGLLWKYFWPWRTLWKGLGDALWELLAYKYKTFLNVNMK